MKRFILFFLSGIVVLSYLSCSKSTPTPVTPPCTNKSVDADAPVLIAFAGDSIPLTHDSTGLYYHIVDSGNATKPTISSILTVTYTAQLMDKTVFDSATNSNLQGVPLSNLIPGWIIGMPKIGVGGRIKLFIPSALAWGCNGVVNPATNVTIIPPDAPVYFDVTLLGVN
jgi:FKBP-type peptidyl-prolyl cis-trans isomerase FkpA